MAVNMFIAKYQNITILAFNGRVKLEYDKHAH